MPSLPDPDELDLPPREELLQFADWFKRWYGRDWEASVGRALGASKRCFAIRLHGSHTITREFLDRLDDLQSSLVAGASAARGH